MEGCPFDEPNCFNPNKKTVGYHRASEFLDKYKFTDSVISKPVVVDLLYNYGETKDLEHLDKLKEAKERILKEIDLNENLQLSNQKHLAYMAHINLGLNFAIQILDKAINDKK